MSAGKFVHPLCTEVYLATYFTLVALLFVSAVISAVTVYRLLKLQQERSSFPLRLLVSMIAMYTCVTLQFVFLVAARADLCLGEQSHLAPSFVILSAIRTFFNGYHWCFFDLVLYYRLKIVFAPSRYAVSRTTSLVLLSCLVVSLVLRFLKVTINVISSKDPADTDDTQILLLLSFVLNFLVTEALSVLFLHKLYKMTRDYMASNEISIGDAKVDISSATSSKDIAANYAIIIRNTILSVTSSLVSILFIIGMIMVSAEVSQALVFLSVMVGLDVFTNVVCISLSMPFFNPAYRVFCGCADRATRACCKRCIQTIATKRQSQNEKNLVMMTAVTATAGLQSKTKSHDTDVDATVTATTSNPSVSD